MKQTIMKSKNIKILFGIFMLLNLFAVPQNLFAQQEGATCDNPLVYNSNEFSYSGTTCGFGDDVAIGGGTLVQFACNNAYIGGEDMVILFTPTETSCYTVELNPETSDVGASFAVFGTCPNEIIDIGQTADNCLGIAGAVGNLGGVGNLFTTNNYMEAGVSYYIVVSSYNGLLGSFPCGNFELNVFIPDAVENDFCGNAVSLVGFGSNYEATDCGEPDDWAPENMTGVDCDGGAWSSNENGVWYTFTNDIQQDVNIEIFNIQCENSSSNTLQVGVWSNNNTCDLAAENFFGCIVVVGDAILSLPDLPIGEYYLYADGNAGADCTWEFASEEILCDIETPIAPLLGTTCVGGNLPSEISVTAADSTIITWYDNDPANEDAIVLGIGETLILPDFVSSETVATFSFYATATSIGDENCESEAVVINLFVVTCCDATFELGEDIDICDSETILLTAAVGFDTYLWNTGETTADILVATEGAYWCEVTLGNENCAFTDTVNVSVLPLPTIALPAEINLCAGESVELVIESTNADSFLWENGETSSSITVSQAGVYTATVSNECLSVSATTIVNISDELSLELGENTTFCLENNNILDATNAAATAYLWQDGSTLSTLEVTEAGVYSVTISNECATATDEVCVVVESCEAACESMEIEDLVDCFDNATYQVYVSVSGGVAPYTVSGTYNGMITLDDEMISLELLNIGENYNLTITDNNGCVKSVLGKPECAALPIELLDFKGKALENKNALNWTTVSEHNNAFFTLERSFDGQNFKAIAQIEGQGTSNQTKNYSFDDTHIAATQYYYRLLQTDFDGTTHILPTIQLYRHSETTDFTVQYHEGYFEVGTTLAYSNTMYKAYLYDMSGKQLAEKRFSTNCTFDTSQFSSAVYLIRIENNTETKTFKVLKW
ncbi:MAG: T9SS type A sorting domain-containing protein [Chitinophagales bacterium]